MKKILLTFVLLVGIVFGLFAQQLTYQAVIRDNNQQLVTNAAMKATVTITFETGNPYTETVNATTNIHGLLTFEFGDASLIGRDFEGATITTTVKSADESVVYVNNLERPVSAVPYALSVNGQSIQNYLNEHHYVTQTQVGRQIHDSIANIGGMSPTQDHSHSNMAVLNATTASFTTAKQTTLDSLVAIGAQKNVQSNWEETTTTSDAYILNKPNIPTTVADLSDAANYVTNDALTTLLTNMNNKMDSLARLVDSLSNLPHGGGGDNAYCDDVMRCVGDTLGQLNAKIENLQNKVAEQENIIDNLSNTVELLNNRVFDGQPCLGAATVKDDNNNEYPTVKIGNQCWMAQNLRRAGIWGHGKTYENSDGEIYYDWNALMFGASSTNYPQSGEKMRGFCPEGWHVPSKNEWETLITYVRGVDAYKCNGGIANALSVGGDSCDVCCAGDQNSETLNKTGFSARLVGACFFTSDDNPIPTLQGYAPFWSATECSESQAWAFVLNKRSTEGELGGADKISTGLSVRCLRDAGVVGTPGSNETAAGHADGSPELR